MPHERTKLIRKAEIQLETRGGAVTFEFYTGQSEAAMALQKSESLNTGGDMETHTVLFGGDTKGRLYSIRIDGSAGVSAVIESIRIFRKVLDPTHQTTWEWVDVPVERTNLQYQPIDIPVEATPLPFRPVEIVPPPGTPSLREWVDLPMDE